MSMHQRLQRLQKYVHEFESVLDQDEFYAQELDVDDTSTQTTINLLRTCGAIEKVDSKREKESLRWKWGWCNYRDELKEYHEDQETLPCDCRPHVPSERDGDTFYCKFCGEGHDRQTIKEAL